MIPSMGLEIFLYGSTGLGYIDGLRASDKYELLNILQLCAIYNSLLNNKLK